MEQITASLRAADALTARALELLADLRGGVADGLPVELVMRLDARLVGWDARSLVAAAALLRDLPRARGLLAVGVISPGQIRSIAGAIRSLRVEDRRRVDALIAARAPALVDAEPEQLLDEVDAEVARLADDQLARRETHAIQANFLVLQPRLDGGGILYGQADAEAFATVAEAVEVAADDPISAEDDPGSRARQRMDALVGICETSLAGSGAPTRPRPRFSVILDTSDPEPQGRLLARVAGRPIRLSRLATQTMLCDAQIQPFVFRNGQPLGAGDVLETIPAKLRAAVVARDGGCRFPGCRAPAGWSDVHHIRWREDGGGNDVQNLILLCRRCHRRIHTRRWRISFAPDGTAVFTHRRRRYTSQPRARAPVPDTS